MEKLFTLKKNAVKRLRLCWTVNQWTVFSQRFSSLLYSKSVYKNLLVFPKHPWIVYAAFPTALTSALRFTHAAQIPAWPQNLCSDQVLTFHLAKTRLPSGTGVQPRAPSHAWLIHPHTCRINTINPAPERGLYAARGRRTLLCLQAHTETLRWDRGTSVKEQEGHKIHQSEAWTQRTGVHKTREGGTEYWGTAAMVPVAGDIHVCVCGGGGTQWGQTDRDTWWLTKQK